ncbi:MAG: xanthine dehydrogenase family protein subunit M [Candidatus Binatia bacterium]|jgi:carbon-monoxide dehydrogenase medium subunit|nr:xanthine dehydrogenase family protein subunit M [Candidatus Binatia bacterium]
MLRPFFLEEPETVQEASALLARYGESAKIYAGGTELLLAMKESLLRSERLINIKKISSMDQVKEEDGLFRIGALVTHRKLEDNAILGKRLSAWVTLEQNVANVRIRGVGTIGGNLCFAEPHSDPGVLLVALNASVILEKGSSRREIPMENFFLDAFETSLQPDEILTEIRVPMPPPEASVRYLKFGHLERPSAGVALYLRFDPGKKTIAEARVAVGSVGPRPRRVDEAGDLLRGMPVNQSADHIARAGVIAGRASEAVGDIHGPADYKEHIVQVLLKRAFHSACRQNWLGDESEGGVRV